MTSRSTVIAITLGLGQALAACTQSTAPASAQRKVPSSGQIAGLLLEKFDSPPYTFLLLRTETGEVWAAVPATHVDKEKPVTVLNAVALKNYSVSSTGRRFDVVHFGTLAQPQ